MSVGPEPGRNFLREERVAVVRITGTDQVIKNLNREIQGIRRRSKKGLRAAALIVIAESKSNTPVDTGNLRGSAYQQTFDTNKGPVAEVGYTASYAPFVHEIDKNYTVGGWKFLERALKDKRKDILAAIDRDVRIRG